MAVRLIPASLSHSPSVLPTSMKGRPEENPSASITPTLGRVSARTTSRALRRGGLAGRAAAVTGLKSHRAP